jgi:hypothetical protein
MHACLVDDTAGTVGVTCKLAGIGLRHLLAHDAEALGLAVELVDVDRREAPVVAALYGRQGRGR